MTGPKDNPLEVASPKDTAPRVEYTSRPDEIAATYQSILRQAHEQFQCDVCTLFPLNPITDAFLMPPMTYGDLIAPSGREFESPRTTGLASNTLQTGILVVPDLSVEPLYESNFSRCEGIQAFMAVPLRLQGSTSFAVLYLDYRIPMVFSEQDQRRLREFAAEAARVLQISWLLERYRKVIEIGHRINQGLDTIENLYARLDTDVRDVLDVRSSRLALLDRTTQSLCIFGRDASGRVAEEMVPISDHWATVITEREPLTVAENEHGSVYVPLLLRKEILGVLAVEKSHSKAYGQEDVHLLRLISNQVATAINGVRVFASLDALHRVGQSLTDDVRSSNLSDILTEQIRQVTKADVVVLYEFSPTATSPATPSIAGILLHPEKRPSSSRPTTAFAVHVAELEKPEFIEHAEHLTAHLRIGAVNEGEFAKRERIASVAAVPLRVGSTSVGALLVNYRAPQSFDGPLKRLISILAVYVANAIANADTYNAQEQRRRKELKILGRVAQSRGLREVLYEILKSANEIVGAESASVILLEGERLRTMTAIGRNARLTQAWSQPLDHERSIVRWVIQNRTPARIDDVAADAFWKPLHVDVGGGTVAEMDVPLIDGDSAIGVLNFESPSAGKFTDDHLVFVQTLAQSVVNAVKRAQLLDAAEKSARELTSVVRLARQIGQVTAVEQYHAIIEFAANQLNATASALLLRDGETQRLRIAASRGLYGVGEGAVDEGVIRDVARHRTPYAGDPNRGVEGGPILSSFRSAVVVPLGDNTTSRGVLLVASEEPQLLGRTAIPLLEAVASIAVLALQNTERHRVTEQERDRLEALQKVVLSSDDTGEVLKALVHHALVLTRANRSDVDLVENGEIVKTYYCNRTETGDPSPVTEEDLVRMPRVLVRGIMKHVMETGEAYWTKGDAQSDEKYEGNQDIQSEVAVRVDASPTVRLVLNVESNEPLMYGKEDARRLSRFGSEAVVAFHIAQSREHAERERARFQTLIDVGEKLGKLTDERGAACKVVGDAAAAQCRSLAVVRLLNPATKMLMRISFAGDGAEPFEIVPLNEGLNGRVFKTLRTEKVEDRYNQKETDPPINPSDPADRSYMTTPILHQAVYFGSLGMSRHEPDYFTDADGKLIEGLAQLLGVTLHRMESVQEKRSLLKVQRESEIVTSIGRAAFEIAHRLGNDLGTVRSHANNVRAAVRESDHARFDRELSSIVDEVQRVLKLTTNLREQLSDLKESEPVDTSIERIIDAVQKETEKRRPDSVEVIYTVPSDVAPVRTGFEDATTVLSNLVSNAFDAMRATGGVLTITASNAEKFVEIEIADTGPGIPPSIEPTMFDLLVSGKGGFGFGLWSARGRARANGGGVTLRTPIPAVFLYTIPRSDLETEGQHAERRS